MYIKDLQSGEVRKYGSNHHDALRVSRDGTILSYENLQNGDGSRFGDYRFCDEDGLIPEEDEVLLKYGADAYFNIGGFVEVVRCKDCKYWKHTNGSFGRCSYEYWDENERFRTYIERFCDDFCSDGERKDGEADDDTGSNKNTRAGLSQKTAKAVEHQAKRSCQHGNRSVAKRT